MTRPLSIEGVCALFIWPLAAAAVEVSDASSRAETILIEAAEYLAAQNTFSFEVEILYEGRFAGDQEILVTDYAAAFKRPDDIYVHVRNRDIEIVFHSDGTHYIRYIPEFAQYVREGAALSASEVVASSGFEVIESTLGILSEFMRERPFGDADALTDAAYIGEEEWNGFDTHHIRLTYAGTACEMWIEQGDRPFLRRVVPDMSDLEADYEQRAGIKFEMDVAAEIATWEVGREIDDKLAFNPPEGAEEVSAFRPPQPESEAEKMVGSMAPDFSVALLDGGTLKLSEKRGDIVILDFWATWCGPCRIAMPVLSRVSKEFAAQGVRLYGVDLEEGPTTIKAYLERQGLDVTVALDRDGSIAELYKVTGIPQTVIIDREGKVAVMHVGLWAVPPADLGSDATEDEIMKSMDEALAEALRKELRALIAGTTLTD